MNKRTVQLLLAAVLVLTLGQAVSAEGPPVGPGPTTTTTSTSPADQP